MAALLATLLLLGALATPVFAHGALKRSSPSAGEHLAEVPRELKLTFTEAVELAFTRLALTGPDGPVGLAPLALAPDSATVLLAGIRGPLRPGRYQVSWQVAGADGHPVRGQYFFVIAPGARGAPAALGPIAPGQTSPPRTHHEPTTFPQGSGFDAESPLYAVVRWLTFVTLLAVIGAVAFRLVVLRLLRLRDAGWASELIPAASSRAARLGLWAAVGLALAALLRLYAQSVALHGGAAALQPALLGTMLSRTIWGWAWVAQAVGTGLALLGFARAARAPAALAEPRGVSAAAPTAVASVAALGSDPAGTSGAAVAGEVEEHAPHGQAAPESPPTPDAPVPGAGMGWAAAALGVLILAFTPAFSGHAAATTRFAPLPVLADGLHVLGAGGWLGSLLVLVAAGLPAALALAADRRGPAVAALVGAFSPTALGFAALVTLTGVFAGWLHLGSVPALWQSAYGRTLLVKLAVLGGVFGTGAYNWLRVLPALGTDEAAGRLRRSATAELLVGLVVLAATAVLVATGTPAAMEPGMP